MDNKEQIMDKYKVDENIEKIEDWLNTLIKKYDTKEYDYNEFYGTIRVKLLKMDYFIDNEYDENYVFKKKTDYLEKIDIDLINEIKQYPDLFTIDYEDELILLIIED